jgi:hypothetical protein
MLLNQNFSGLVVERDHRNQRFGHVQEFMASGAPLRPNRYLRRNRCRADTHRLGEERDEIIDEDWLFEHDFIHGDFVQPYYRTMPDNNPYKRR